MTFNYRKPAACFLAAVMLAAGVCTAGCSGKEKEREYVPEGASWYEYTSVDIEDVIDYSRYDEGTTQTRFIGVAGDKLVFTFSGPSHRREETGYAYSEELMLITYDKQGHDPEVVSLDELLVEQYPELEDTVRCNYFVNSKGDRIKIDMTVTFSTSDVGYYYVYLDLISNEFSDLTEKDTYMAESSQDFGLASRCDGFYVTADMQYGLYAGAEDDIVIRIASEDGQQTELSVAQLDPQLVYCELRSLFRLSENNMILELSDYNGSRFIKIDLDTKELSLYSDDLPVLDTLYYHTGQYVEGIGNILITGSGIKLVDLTGNTVSDYFDYNCCNMNMMLLDTLNIDYIDSDTIVMSGMRNNQNDPYSVIKGNNLAVYVLTRSETNPNVGKQIIKAASVSGLNYVTAEGICRFNEQSSTHRIVLDPRYNLDTVKYDYLNGGTDMSPASMVYNNLMVDLMSEEGPDILFDAYDLTQLCSDQYLIDLSDLAFPEDVFTNVVDATRTDGKLYNVPLSFDLHGLITRSGYVSADQVGFTFDQYDGFVHTVCNGKDPTGLSRQDFFMECLSLCGISDYRSDEFWQIAEYANERYIEPADLPDQDMQIFYEPAVDSVIFEDIRSPELILDLYGADVDDMVLMALPSSDGRGSNISINGSVAITSGTLYEQECREFISLLLTPQIQTLYDLSTGNSVTRSGVEDAVREVSESFNWYAGYLDQYGQLSSIRNQYNADQIDADTFVEVYEAMIDRCVGTPCLDSEQEAVIREEMGAYFAGQKTPDEIAVIIDDRLTTIAHERG